MNQLDRLDISRIKHSLSRSSDTTADVPNMWPKHELNDAAVLIPLIRQAEAWHLLYIRRAEHEDDHHSGQVAFAGGKYERHDESLHATALREAQEEIGLDPRDVEILGELGHHYSISRFKIKPVVAHIPWPYPLSLDKNEVARAFTIPLSWLADERNYRMQQRRFYQYEVPVVYYAEYETEMLWGATARMTLSLLEKLKRC